MAMFRFFFGHETVAGGDPVLTADPGSYAITGATASLNVGYVLAAAAGSYSHTGTDATLSVGRYLSAEAGSYSLTGSAATLVYTPAGAYNLVVDAGSYSLTGTAAGLVVSRIVTGEFGVYTITGSAATLSVDDPSRIDVTGVSATGHILSAAVWTGSTEDSSAWGLVSDSSGNAWAEIPQPSNPWVPVDEIS